LTRSRPGTVFVVGGSGGLGSAICRCLAREWGAVCFTYHRNVEAARSLQAELGERTESDFCQLDLSSSTSIEAAFAYARERFGDLGSVVFAGGTSIPQPFVVDIAAAQWADVINVELLGFTRLVKEVIPQFRARGGGTLVAVTSFAPYHFPPGDALSAVPKAGIEVLCRAIAKEEGRFGIRANSVAPGIVNAGLGQQFQQSLFTPEVWDAQRKRVPLKRFGEGNEIAEAVGFLAGSRSGYITGQTLIVDGGLSL
jgi:NAD(P)-dependent dehydrogenase (short-subunit alcohol dehydrogenase family)